MKERVITNGDIQYLIQTKVFTRSPQTKDLVENIYIDLSVFSREKGKKKWLPIIDTNSWSYRNVKYNERSKYIRDVYFNIEGIKECVTEMFKEEIEALNSVNALDIVQPFVL